MSYVLKNKITILRLLQQHAFANMEEDELLIFETNN